MTHGPQRNFFDLSFSVPSECADRVATGDADLGIVPVAEIQRFGWPFLQDVGIACRGPVRSILLVSKTPPGQIRSLAADSSSRTSVMLARVVLQHRYACRPIVRTHQPDLANMLADSDAALIIGDPALRIEPNSLPFHVLDLGKEWTEMTGLPMVFALWAGQAQFVTEEHRAVFAGSCRYGLEHLDDVIAAAEDERKLSAEVIRTYLTQHIAFELCPDDLRGLELFWSYTADM